MGRHLRQGNVLAANRLAVEVVAHGSRLGKPPPNDPGFSPVIRNSGQSGLAGSRTVHAAAAPPVSRADIFP
jgi:hypothetical protein